MKLKTFVVETPRLIVAPNYRQALLFCNNMVWDPSRVVIALTERDLLGLRLENWEVWWLDRMWPSRTHEDVENMLALKRLARSRGADIRHWWT